MSEKMSKKIPVSSSLKIPPIVLESCQKISDQGFKAWLAGGCVRDMVLNKSPRDWDIVTNAPLEKLTSLFPNHLEVGKNFGILKLKPVDPSYPTIDIAIFRKDGEYKDFRHPEKIEPGDEFTDSARRDFTMNSLYFDPESKIIEDFTGGYKDIQSKLIRTVGNPHERFTEDALRVLRGIRFMAQLGFKLEKETSSSLKKNISLVRNISRERVREEVFRILESPRPLVGLDAIAQNGLWENVFGVRRVSLPADLRQLKLTWVPNPLHWLCALSVTGLLGDPQKEPQDLVERLAEYLKLGNHEKKTITKILKVYSECHKENPEESSSPIEWIELAKQDKSLMDITKSFIRRARGPSEEEKSKAITLIEQVLRWSTLKGDQIDLPGAPKADELMKSGVEKGPKLGKTIRLKQWEVFWAKKPGM